MKLRLAVLGDSIAFGQGAARPEDTPAERLRSGLAVHGFEAEPRVFAASGARSADLRGQVDRAVTWSPDVAVVVIGANDLTHGSPVARAAADLGDGVRRLRRAGAEVVVAPAPDLSAVPHVPVEMRPLVREGSRRFRAQQVRAVTAAGGRIADGDDATSDAFAADRTLFSRDRFHPSSAGYAVIVRALLPVVLEALGQEADELGA